MVGGLTRCRQGSGGQAEAPKEERAVKGLLKKEGREGESGLGAKPYVWEVVTVGRQGEERGDAGRQRTAQTRAGQRLVGGRNVM